MGTFGGFEASVDSDVLEAFLAENDIDEKAADYLRSADPEGQQAVIEKGSLHTAKNKSSALMVRIRNAKTDIPDAGVHQFIADNGIDEDASQALCAEPGWIQKAVMEAGPLTNANNPSSALMVRLRKTKMMGGGMGGGKSRREIQRFIEENNLDEKAGQVLLSESGAVQRDVIEMGSLANASNPSSALMVRIRRAKSNEPKGGGWGGGMEMMPMMMGGGMPMLGMMMGGGNRKKGGKGGSAIWRFVQENGLDEKAANALSEEPPDVQAKVMDGGPLTNSYNPSSALMVRIRNARKARGPY